jgi:hypothetical protein
MPPLAFSMPQYVVLYSVLLGSMFGGASVAHGLLRPNLALRPRGGGGGGGVAGAAVEGSAPAAPADGKAVR